jgi:alpha-tubulin suppressor-like RCC1 family protein
VYTPLGWGSNRYLTLLPDPLISVVKKPVPLTNLGSTPFRDLALAEKYGAVLDAKGDCWMWGVGYDPSGQIGRSLRNKVSTAAARLQVADNRKKLKTLASGPGKLFALSRDGKLYCVSAIRAFQAHRQDLAEQSWWSWLFSSDAGVDHIELKPEGGFKRGERWSGVATGMHHLLAVTNKGRTFSLPLSPAGNSHRQLGTRENLGIPTSGDLPPDFDPRFAREPAQIPALSGIAIEQVAASDRTSFVRTPTGRVLGFGANELGQVGLGGGGAVEIVQTPVEIVLARSYPGGTYVRALDISAGGSTTMFTVQREMPGKDGKFIDLLACGNGISGALGNGLWISASSIPTRVKTVSGLQECTLLLPYTCFTSS